VPAPVSASKPGTPAAERMAADTPRTTASGVKFVVPSGWSIATSGALVVLELPEPDSHIAIFDAGEAADAAAAIAAAWKAFAPESALKARQEGDVPGRDGWSGMHFINYDTPPNEKRFVQAAAFRKDKTWTVVIADAKVATLEKRGAQAGLLLQSLRPGGYDKESFAGKKANPLDAARVKKIGEFIEMAQKALDIPGVAISLVQDGKVVFEGGFGVRELGKPQKVDADTLFIIASNTKAMTTLLLAKLVDAGKLTWDTPVAQLWPTFKLGNDEITKSVQVKHLVCACTGLPRQDLEFIFEFGRATPETEMGVLASIVPTTKFGETFQYSNLLAAAAGFLAAHVLAPGTELGKAYDQAMQKEIFAPLGMKTATFDTKRALAADHASPHDADVDGKPALALAAVNGAIVPLRPAGGAWASVKDVRKYVQLELSGGLLPDGKRFISQDALFARRKPGVPVGEHATYGMGLTIDTEYGIPVIHHGGSMIGFKSDMIWLPEAGVGAVILTNSDSGQALLGPFSRFLLEVLFDGKPEAAEDVATTGTLRRENLAKERARLTVPADAAAAAKLAPHYANDALGTIDVRAKGGKVVFDFTEWQSEVASHKNDDGTMSFVTLAPGIGGVDLVAGEKEGKKTLTVRDGQHEYVFVEGEAGKAGKAGAAGDKPSGKAGAGNEGKAGTAGDKPTGKAGAKPAK
jgi:CubicO group peptidase (beta-lactamase class C family)